MYIYSKMLPFLCGHLLPSELKRTELNKVNVSCSLVFFSVVCFYSEPKCRAFYWNEWCLSACAPGWTAPFLHLHAMSLLWDGDCAKNVSETMYQRMKELHDFFSFRVKRSFDFRGHFFISKFKFFFSKTFNIFLIFIQLDTLLLNVGMVKKMLFDSQTSFNLWSCKFIKANQYSENWLFLPTHFKQSVSRDQEISLLGKMSAFKDQWRTVTKRWEGYVRCLGQHTGRLLGPSRFLRRIYSSLHQFTLFIYEPFSLPI